MKHALITRFALRFPENSVRRSWEREGWLDYRLELLRKYTLPSVQAQTFTDFDWWFLIDPTFPGFELEHFNELKEYGKLMTMDDPFVEEQPEIGVMLSDRYKDEWVCSTRIDSDDIIRNDFMERVHEEATEKEEWISFRKGYMLKGDEIAPRSFVRNPFVSYVEYAAPFKSVFHIDHMQVHARSTPAPLKIIEETPGWIQVDHSDNVKNLVSQKLPNFESQLVDLAPVREDFTWRT